MKKDILDQKKRELNTYATRFNNAVSTITGTIEDLGVISQQMADTIDEIEAYQMELDATKEGLFRAKEKNDRVMENFKRLVGEV